MDAYQIALVAITFGAAIVNGALGYGFSSITVPLALLFLTNRVLNPALVPIEVALNAYVLWVNRAALPGVWRRVLPIVIGLSPGVLLGTALVSQVNPGWLKFLTFIVLLPLILFQAAGYRRPIQSERSVGFVFGGGVGLLYSVTTISGPPLAVLLSNQGLTKQDFRAALGFIRLAESSFTAVAYYYAGLYSLESMGLIPYILPSILVGVPIGAVLIQRIRPDVLVDVRSGRLCSLLRGKADSQAPARPLLLRQDVAVPSRHREPVAQDRGWPFHPDVGNLDYLWRADSRRLGHHG